MGEGMSNDKGSLLQLQATGVQPSTLMLSAVTSREGWLVLALACVSQWELSFSTLLHSVGRFHHQCSTAGKRHGTGRGPSLPFNWRGCIKSWVISIGQVGHGQSLCILRDTQTHPDTPPPHHTGLHGYIVVLTGLLQRPRKQSGSQGFPSLSGTFSCTQQCPGASL